MRKSTLYILISLAAILVAGIIIALKSLYPGKEDNNHKVDPGQAIERHELIEAVPSDAAIVFCVKNFGRALEYLGDTTAIFRKITSGKFDKIARESFEGIRRDPAIISIHYSKDMPPLLVVKPSKAISDSVSNDCSKLMALADSSGLFAKVSGEMILISSSETIANSSARHLAEGHSVLESTGFAELAGQVPGSDILFVSNTYSDNILDTYFARKHRKLNGFFKEIALWSAFSVTRHSDTGVSMDGTLLYGSDPSYYMNVLRHAGTGPVKVAEAVPSNTDFILDLPIGNIGSYLKAYRNYLDSKAKLDKYESLLAKQKKSSGKSAEDWAKSLDLKEVAIVNIHFGGRLRQLLFLKPGGKKLTGEGIEDFSPYAGFPQTIFGEIFTGEDEYASAVVNGWLVVGARDCLDELIQTSFEPLKERLSASGLIDRIPQKGCGFWLYHSITEDPNLIGANFSPLMAEGFRDVINGVSYVPTTLFASSKGDKMVLSLDVTRTDIPGGRMPLPSVRDTTVTVPTGEFKVMNSATGKINTLYQNSHLSICLKDENGKDKWGIPFKYTFCGYVKEIDFYKNDKLQYLFAADSKLYLIDRLGRFVGGTPVDIGKKIAVGPEVYDFEGTRDYSAMVLFKDNTVGLFTLDGKPSPTWKGITSDETIKSLPEPLEGGGKRYWIVRTSRQAFVCPFEGGDPVIIGEGKKMIRPDSEITINEKGVFTAKCHDGKERTFKLEKEKR